VARRILSSTLRRRRRASVASLVSRQPVLASHPRQEPAASRWVSGAGSVVSARACEARQDSQDAQVEADATGGSRRPDRASWVGGWSPATSTRSRYRSLRRFLSSSMWTWRPSTAGRQAPGVLRGPKAREDATPSSAAPAQRRVKVNARQLRINGKGSRALHAQRPAAADPECAWMSSIVMRCRRACSSMERRSSLPAFSYLIPEPSKKGVRF
jgi:hypothetical protein